MKESSFYNWIQSFLPCFTYKLISCLYLLNIDLPRKNNGMKTFLTYSIKSSLSYFFITLINFSINTPSIQMLSPRIVMSVWISSRNQDLLELLIQGRKERPRSVRMQTKKIRRQSRKIRLMVLQKIRTKRREKTKENN